MEAQGQPQSYAVIGIYGRATTHSWLTGINSDHDAYQLFTSRAAAQAWSSSTLGQRDAWGLWGMNDADSLLDNNERSRLGWFQVSFPANGQSLLVPLVSCAWKTIERLGEADIDGVQIVVPPQSRKFGQLQGIRSMLAASLSWFEANDPRDAVEIDVTCDLGEYMLQASELATIAEDTHSTSSPFGLSPSGNGNQSQRLFPEVPAEELMGTARNPLNLHGRLPEWTSDSVGWLISSIVADLQSLSTGSYALINIAKSLPKDRPLTD